MKARHDETSRNPWLKNKSFNHKGHEGTQRNPGSEVEQFVSALIVFNFQFYAAIGIPRYARDVTSIQLPQPLLSPVNAQTSEERKRGHAGDHVRNADDARQRSGDEAADGR